MRLLLFAVLLALPAVLSAQEIPLPADAWTAHVAADEAAWGLPLDLRTLPADTRPATLSVALDLGRLPAGARPVLTASVNGRVFAHRWPSAGTRETIDLPVEQKLFSVVNRIDIALACAGCAAARLDGVSVTLAPVVADITDFARAVTRLRRGVAVEVQAGADPALGRAVLAALAPYAPHDPAATARIVVGALPPAGFTPPLLLDTATRLETKSGFPLYDAAALRAFTAVQLLRDGDRIAIWIRPGTGAALPAAFRLDHGDVALFGRGRREIAWSTRSDVVIHAVHAVLPGGLTAGELRVIGAGLFWLAATAGIWWIARRLPRPRRAAEA